MGRNLSTKEMSLFIYQAVRPFRLSIFIMCMVGIVWAIDCSLCPYLLKTITDRISTISEVSRSNIFSNIGPPVAIYFFMTLINPTVFRFYNYFVDVKMMPNLRWVVSDMSLKALLNQSYSYYQNHFAGSLALSIAIFTLWQVNYVFAVSMLTWLTTSIICSIFLARKFARLSSYWSEYGNAFTGKMADSLLIALL